MYPSMSINHGRKIMRLRWRTMTWTLTAIVTLALAGCGSSSSPTARNEAAWALAKRQAHEQIAPQEALLGVEGARHGEEEIAKAAYEATVAREHATPTERHQAEAEEQEAEGG